MQQVWIKDGCVTCKICEELVPSVFRVVEQGALIKKKFLTEKEKESVLVAVEQCPVAVIEFDF